MENLVIKTRDFVKDFLADSEGGHDWFHIERVFKTSCTIAEKENCNLLVVKLSALLHDIADSKFHKGDETIGPRIAREFLEKENAPEEITTHVIHIIENISFKGGREKQTFHSRELDIVQDADRLDAMGAVGIARTFNYGGFKNRKIYDPDIAPNLHMNKEQYKNSTAPTINHFYEKLLLLKNTMNTQTGREMAESRHKFMEEYLNQFFAEWNGK